MLRTLSHNLIFVGFLFTIEAVLKQNLGGSIMPRLDFLPEVWDADDLGDLFLTHLEEINAYLKADMEKALRLFTIEQLVDQDHLHDDSYFVTISFSKEGVAAYRDSQFKSGWAINPRDVIASLALALRRATFRLKVHQICHKKLLRHVLFPTPQNGRNPHRHS